MSSDCGDPVITVDTGFPTVPLAERAGVVMGQSPPGSTYNSEGAGVPFLQGKAEFGDISPSHKKWTSEPLRLAPQGSTLVSVRAPVGDINLADREYCIGRGLSALIAGPDLDKEFLYLWMLYMKPVLEAQGTGSTFKAIRKSVLTDLPVADIALPEQRAIARVLRTVQRAKEATEQVIAAARELKKSLMQHLFTYGPVPVMEVERVRLKETEVGPIPESWAVRTTGSLVSKLKAGGTPKRGRADYWGGEVPFAKVEDVTSSGGLLRSTVETITQEGLEASSAWLVPSGSVLLTMYATIGVPAINVNPVATNQAIIALVPGPAASASYLFRALERFGTSMIRLNVQSTQKNISKRIVESFPLPLPDVAVQDQIVEMMSAVDRKIAAEESYRDALATLFDSLLHDLMTARLRVTDLVSEVT